MAICLARKFVVVYIFQFFRPIATEKNKTNPITTFSPVYANKTKSVGTLSAPRIRYIRRGGKFFRQKIKSTRRLVNYSNDVQPRTKFERLGQRPFYKR